jgi:ParB-like chromosome segregation protein Spo0J
MNLPTQIELRSIRALVPDVRNSRTHSDAQVAQVAASIREFGWTNPILVDGAGVIIAGHARLLAARKLGLEEVPVIVLAHLTPAQKRALVIADNKLALNAGWDEDTLRAELVSLQEDGFDLDVVGFSDEELRVLLADQDGEAGTASDETIPEAPVNPVSRRGDVWTIGKHRLLCGDCRDSGTVVGLLDGAKVNVAITSPPYASQREYDQASGFTPIPPDEYVAWYREVAAVIESVLAADGSYFLNIKEHSEEGERSLYVKDLVIAHRRQWGWRFVDEFCWRNTANGVPGKWPNRLKNAWEPVFHFCRSKEIKFRPKAAGHQSDDVVVYSADNPSAPSGSGLLGCGADKITGIAWPSNVIEAKAEGSQGSHSAPFPRALVEFFVKAFSDPGDIIGDSFLGSGTSIAAAHVLGRVGYGIELSPAYCDVALRRMMALAQEAPVLQETGQTFVEVAESRGVPVGQAVNTTQHDPRRIRHNGPAPFYGRRQKTDASSLVHPGASK